MNKGVFIATGTAIAVAGVYIGMSLKRQVDLLKETFFKIVDFNINQASLDYASIDLTMEIINTRVISDMTRKPPS